MISDNCAALAAGDPALAGAKIGEPGAAGELFYGGESMEQLLYVVSHDLKEPLRTMRSICSRLEKSGQAPAVMDLIGRMSSSSERMFDLVTSILDLAAIGRNGAKKEMVQLGSVVGEVISDLEQLILESGGIVKVSPLPEIEADRVQMRQLFQNLLSNSLKSAKPGKPVDVAINVISYGWNRVELSVRDDGCGIPQARLGELFNRTPGKSGHCGAGCGIGLLICRTIVEMHHGSITVESESGRGTSVTVALPVRQP